jgi:hypothetical protein
MVRNSVRLVLIGMFAYFFAFGASEAQKNPFHSPPTGGRWLSWNVETRGDFVDSYLEGDLDAKIDACHAAYVLFVPRGTPDGTGENSLEGKCFRAVKSYTQTVDEYVSVITDFYTKYPQYRNFSALDLLRAISDGHYTTADGLNQMVLKGQL